MNLRAISLVALPVIAMFILPGCGPGGEGASPSDAAPVIVDFYDNVIPLL